MLYLVATYRAEKGGKIQHIREWRSSKGKFKQELKEKGFISLDVYTPTEIIQIKREDLTNTHNNSKWYIQKNL